MSKENRDAMLKKVAQSMADATGQVAYVVGTTKEMICVIPSSAWWYVEDVDGQKLVIHHVSSPARGQGARAGR